MQLSDIATLACLELNQEAAPKLQADLDTILNFVATLKTIDTANVEPLINPIDSTWQQTRPDVVSEQNNIEALETLATNFRNGLYTIPKLINVE